MKQMPGHNTRTSFRDGSRGGDFMKFGGPPFGGPPNFIKREKTSRVCARMAHILVLNSYSDPPLSEILYPPLSASAVYDK